MKILRIAATILWIISLFMLIGFSNTTAKAKDLNAENGPTYTSPSCGFTVSLPPGSTLQTDFETDTYMRVVLPILQPGTNLVEKFIEIECSSEPQSRDLNVPYITSTSTATFNEINFQVQQGEEQGAGNLYQAVKYSAEKQNQYALLTCVLKSGNPMNYNPPVSQFDYQAESAICEEIVRSFIWAVPVELPPTEPATPVPAATQPPDSPLPIIDSLLAHLDTPINVIGIGTVDTHNVLLTWISPFETIDQPYQYDLRYADFPINAGNWESATKIENVPAPAQSHSSQETIVTVPLYKRFYFGIRVVDQSGNLSSLGFTPSFLDTGFRPDENGYRFCNKGDLNSARDCNSEWLKYPIGINDDLMRQLFGDAICLKIAGECYYDPIVATWILSNQDFSGGVCYGMSASSLALTDHVGPDNWNDPGDVDPRSKNVSEIGESYANQSVAFYQVSQTLSQFNKDLTKYETDSQSFLTKLYGLFESQDPPILVMVKGNGRSGHAIIPYAIEEYPNGLYHIWVYDPNWPPPYDQEPEKRVFIVKTNPEGWEYEFSPNTVWNNTAYEVALLPISAYQQQPFSFGIGNLSHIFPNIFTNLAITNSQGQTLGYINGELVNQIPNARVIPYLDQSVTERDPYYELPVDAYTISVRSNQPGMGKLAYFGTDYALVFDNLALTSEVQDEITIDPNGKQISYQAANAQKLKLSSIYREAEQTITLEFTDLAVESGKTLKVEMNNHAVALRQLPTNGNYALTVERLTSTSYEKFTGVSLPSAMNDTQVISYGVNGDVKILIDHQSDGSIEETITLQKTDSRSTNSLPATTMSTPLIFSIIGCLSLLGLGVAGSTFVFLRTRKTKKTLTHVKSSRQSIKPSMPESEQLKYASRLAREKKYPEAYKLLREIVQSEPENAKAWYYLGGVFVNTGQFQNAENCFRKAGQLGHPRANEALEWLKTHKT